MSATEDLHLALERELERRLISAAELLQLVELGGDLGGLLADRDDREEALVYLTDLAGLDAAGGAL